MKKLVLTSSVFLSFSLYILFATSDTPQMTGALANLPAVTNPPAPKKAVALAPAAPPPPSTPTPIPVLSKGMYKDGVYTGPVADAYYGNVQVQVTVANGKIANVNFLNHPQDRSTSIYINNQAMPILVSEAIQAQNANVDIVSGATDTSMAFQQSLATALVQAKA